MARARPVFIGPGLNLGSGAVGTGTGKNLLDSFSSSSLASVTGNNEIERSLPVGLLKRRFQKLFSVVFFCLLPRTLPNKGRGPSGFFHHNFLFKKHSGHFSTAYSFILDF